METKQELMNEALEEYEKAITPLLEECEKVIASDNGVSSELLSVAYNKAVKRLSEEYKKQLKEIFGMTELKTLKELSAEFRYVEIRVDRLRQEAINWIKEHRRHNFDCCPDYEDGQYNGMCMAKPFKEFFNISEEDLKCAE